jgi:hypothetical protein
MAQFRLTIIILRTKGRLFCAHLPDFGAPPYPIGEWQPTRALAVAEGTRWIKDHIGPNHPIATIDQYDHVNDP